MPNGCERREYGKHKYDAPGGTSDCKYGCGCWMGSARSGGPVGLDPFGVCPGNPKSGEPLGGKGDYEYVVNERIADLESRLSSAEDELERLRPGKVKLAAKLVAAEEKLAQREGLLNELRRLLGSIQIKRRRPHPVS